MDERLMFDLPSAGAGVFNLAMWPSRGPSDHPHDVPPALCVCTHSHVVLMRARKDDKGRWLQCTHQLNFKWPKGLAGGAIRSVACVGAPWDHNFVLVAVAFHKVEEAEKAVAGVLFMNVPWEPGAWGSKKHTGHFIASQYIPCGIFHLISTDSSVILGVGGNDGRVHLFQSNPVKAAGIAGVVSFTAVLAADCGFPELGIASDKADEIASHDEVLAFAQHTIARTGCRVVAVGYASGLLRVSHVTTGEKCDHSNALDAARCERLGGNVQMFSMFFDGPINALLLYDPCPSISANPFAEGLFELFSQHATAHGLSLTRPPAGVLNLVVGSAIGAATVYQNVLALGLDAPTHLCVRPRHDAVLSVGAMHVMGGIAKDVCVGTFAGDVLVFDVMPSDEKQGECEVVHHQRLGSPVYSLAAVDMFGDGVDEAIALCGDGVRAFQLTGAHEKVSKSAGIAAELLDLVGSLPGDGAPQPDCKASE